MWREQFRENVFGNFYLPFCERSVAAWRDCGGLERHFLSSHDVAVNCYRQLREIPVRTLIFDLHRRKEKHELYGADPAAQYAYYHETLLTQEAYIAALEESGHPGFMNGLSGIGFALLEISVDQMI